MKQKSGKSTEQKTEQTDKPTGNITIVYPYY